MLADRIFGAPARRDPPRRRKKPARGRNPKPAARGRGRGRRRASPEVMQRRLDLAGLACIGLAVYLGYVIYLGWNGGTVGDGSHTALSYAVGAGAIVVPVALGLAGVGLILRPFLPSPKSVAVGVAAIACGLLLALAAQTAGLGPEGVRKGLFDPAFFPDHGGGLGEVLYWATSTLFDRIGAHIVAVVLIASGLLLLTGRSVSDMVRAGRRGFDRAKRGTVGFATAIKESRIRTDPDLIDTAPADTEPVFGPPEPVADGEDFHVVVGGDEQETEKVANFDEAVRVADEPDTSELQDLEESDEETIKVAKPKAPELHAPGSEAEDVGIDGEAVEGPGEKNPVPLTPMGKPRTGVTESEEIDYETPIADQVLERGAPDKGPDKQDHEEIAPQPARDAWPLRRRGEDRRHRDRPAREPLRAQAGARHQGLEDHPAQGRPRLRPCLDRHPDPGADPRQAGRRSGGPQPAAPPRPPRRHLRRSPAGVLAAGRLAGQGHLGQRRLDRPAEDAPRSDRGHDRLGQVGQRQRDPQLDPAARVAQRGADGPGRPQAGRAQPLREDPAPADAGGDLAAARGQRPRQPDRARWRAATASWSEARGAQPRRAQPGRASASERRRCRTSSA